MQKCSLKAEKHFYLVKRMIASLVVRLTYETCTHSKCSSDEEGEKASPGGNVSVLFVSLSVGMITEKLLG